MKVKRMLGLVFVLVVLASVLAIPASAETQDESMYAWINGGATVSSRLALKSTSGSFHYVAEPASPDGWASDGTEWVYFRGRSSGGSQCTTLDHRNHTGSAVYNDLSYYSGYGYINSYYRLAIEYDNDNPYQYVYLQTSWTP